MAPQGDIVLLPEAGNEEHEGDGGDHQDHRAADKDFFFGVGSAEILEDVCRHSRQNDLRDDIQEDGFDAGPGAAKRVAGFVAELDAYGEDCAQDRVKAHPQGECGVVADPAFIMHETDARQADVVQGCQADEGHGHGKTLENTGNFCGKLLDFGKVHVFT